MSGYSNMRKETHIKDSPPRRRLGAVTHLACQHADKTARVAALSAAVTSTDSLFIRRRRRTPLRCDLVTTRIRRQSSRRRRAP